MIKNALSNEALLRHAQTFAFTVLGVSQLFHAVGMRNVDVSVFRMNHLANKTMLLAFVLGLVLQVAVTELPFLVKVFDTTQLELSEWLSLIAVSTVPLWAHEISCLFRRGKKGN